jgi:hypothetical protein
MKDSARRVGEQMAINVGTGVAMDKVSPDPTHVSMPAQPAPQMQMRPR